RNRSLRERWRKWRRRRPHGAALAGVMLAVLVAAGAVAPRAASHFPPRIDRARAGLHDGQEQMAPGPWEGAGRTLQDGLSLTRGVPFQGDLAGDLDKKLREAEQGQAAADRAAAARDLHRLADRVRFLYGADNVPPEGLRGLAASCRTFWEDRARV